MNSSYFKLPYIISKFEAHNELKNELLERFYNEGLDLKLKNNNNNRTESFTASDWYVDQLGMRKYWHWFLPHLLEHIHPLLVDKYSDTYEIENQWMSSYRKNDFLDWHVHRGCNYSFIYYVELEDKKDATLFRDPHTKEEFQPEIQEGDIIMFPSMIQHSSPIIKTDSIKTILAWNIK